MGNFANWECRTGAVYAGGGQNQVSWFSVGEMSDRHTLIPPDNKEVDPYGGFPQLCPNTNSYSVRLGNDNNGHEAEGLFYTFSIPPDNNKFSLLYYYAVVLQDPGHRSYEQPRFRARVIDVATETEIDCVSFDFASSGNLPGFQQTPIGNAVFKDWTPVSVDLSGFSGKTVRLEFITSDCTFQQHFGYAYVSVGSNCNGSISGSFYCEGDTTITMTAPYGFMEYNWFSDESFTRKISSAQTLVLNAAITPVGSVFPVVVVPYQGYGCMDTLFATIGSAFKPKADAGRDLVSCSKQPAQLGSAPNENYAYSWTPKEHLNNPFIADPTTLTTIFSPTDFIVKTTDLFTGCFSFDTTRITPIVVDTSGFVRGKLVYCPGEELQTSMTVNNTGAAVQWYNGNTIIPGANEITYEPFSVGNYWAQLKQFGCIDSSRRNNLYYASVPKAGFNLNKEIQCLNNPVSFSNTTSIPGNEPVSYNWKFSDGHSSGDLNVEKSFSTTGVYTITLLAITGTDCVDSVSKVVTVIRDCLPLLPTAFTPNKDGRNDEFKPFLVGKKGLKRFAVYNRYGNLVYSTNREGQGWDGTYKGSLLQTNVFVWVVEYIDENNKLVLEKGTVTLIR